MVVGLVIRQVVRCSASLEESVDTLDQKLVAALVFTKRLNLVMPISVNSTAKAIGGRILVVIEHQIMAVRTMPKVPIQSAIAAKAVHYWDQIASVYHTEICSSLKIPCSWSLHKTFQRRCRLIAVIELIVMADFHSLIIKQIRIKWP